jgi:hypothetical protein
MAVSFARDHAAGRVYQVHPTGPVEPDPEDLQHAVAALPAAPDHDRLAVLYTA